MEGRNPYTLQIEAVSRAVLTGTRPLVDGDNGLENVAAIAALL